MNIRDAHKTGIGGSGAGALFGVGFKTVHELYADCLGLLPEKEPSLAMQIGTHNEPFIRQWYEKKTGKTGAPTETIRKSEMPWMIAHLDWMPLGEKDRFAEFKVAGLHSAKEWGDAANGQVPLQYYLQGLHYSIVTGIPEWDLVVLLGTEIKIYPCKQDEELAKELIERERYFWHEHVLKQTPPPIDHTEECGKLINWIHPKNTKPLEWADGEAARLLNTLAKVAVNFEAEKQNFAELKNKITALIGDKDGLKTSEIQVTWKARKDGVRVFNTKLTEEDAA